MTTLSYYMCVVLGAGGLREVAFAQSLRGTQTVAGA